MAENLNYSVMVDGSGNITYPVLSTFKNINGLTGGGSSETLIATAIELDHYGMYTTNLNDAVLAAYYGIAELSMYGGDRVGGISYYSMLSGNTYDIDHGYTTINAAFAYVSADMYAISTNMLKSNTHTGFLDGSGMEYNYFDTTIDMRSGFEVKTSCMYGGWGMKLCADSDSNTSGESDFIVSLSTEMMDNNPFDNYNCFIKLTNHCGWDWETRNVFTVGARLRMPLFTESNTMTTSSVEIRPVIKSDGTISLTVVAVND